MNDEIVSFQIYNFILTKPSVVSIFITALKQSISTFTMASQTSVEKSSNVFVYSWLCLASSEACHLKGLGHTILGNFSTDQMVIELTKI